MKINFFIKRYQYYLFILLIIAFLVIFVNFILSYPTLELSSVLSKSYQEKCLSPESVKRPMWECYELTVDVKPNTRVKLLSDYGAEIVVTAFKHNESTLIRFTPDSSGNWYIDKSVVLRIDPISTDYAQGFVSSLGGKWIRTAKEQPFIPQYIMYDKPDIDRGIQEFVKEHGFSGFHITNLRDFLQNPGYFETVVLKTYRAGGVTHFWMWGDEERKLTPQYYQGDIDDLYQEICTRLGPIPGWTVSYGFDLWEWATKDELESWRIKINNCSSYHHMTGARGSKNKYVALSEEMDYASWEWHRPTIQDYLEHLKEAKGKPSISEDRFRIRESIKYKSKDFDEDSTLIGLWRSYFSGGVGNIWGKSDSDGVFSIPYVNKGLIKYFNDFVTKNFHTDTSHIDDIIEPGICVRNEAEVFCFAEDTSNVKVNINIQSVSVFDIKVPRRIKELPVENRVIKLPYKGHWVFEIKKYNLSNSRVSGL